MTIAKGLIVASLVGVGQILSAPLFAFPALPHKGVAQLSAGTGNTCALLADRHVSCWGNTTAAFSSAPLPVPKIGTAVSVSVGNGFACALLLDQTVWCWGTNLDGQLGDGKFTSRYVNPAPVGTSGNPLTGAVAIAAGDSHACALKFNNTVFCWGSNSDGQLGNWNIGTGVNFNTPIQVAIHDSMSNPALDSVSSISAGARHTCAVRNVGGITAACWGQEKFGRLGDGAPSNVNNPIDSPVGVLAPGGSDNLGLSSDNIISSGTFDTCALLPEDPPKNNSIACWGDNTSGQTGNPFEFGSFTSTPAPVVDSSGNKLENLLKVSTGNAFACALLRTDGSIACWGSNYQGRLGNNLFTDGYSVVPVAVETDGNKLTGFGDMVTGTDHACGLIGIDTVLCWGSNAFGQLGIGSNDTDAHAVPVNPEVDGPIFTDNFDGN